ncbi:MAG: DUF1573 domain-containing protein [Urechidicola sp.]|nr:DUF1573 domain-containing protein [Urechidicola sp.]
MNKLLFIALLIVSSTILAQEKTDKGVFEFENETINYGIISKNSDGNRSFVFTNVGDEPIVITKVKGSCGCTVATKPNDPILPGETAEIGVKYATNRLGGFSKTITITSNASEISKVVRIKGNVVEEGKIAAVIK